MAQKRLANPKQIRGDLIIQRNFWIHPGMCKEIFAGAGRQNTVFQENPMAGRQNVEQAVLNIDPLVFSKGREITVTGKITSIDVRKVDDFDYRYPVMEVDDLVLWQKRRVVMRYRGYNDGFYGPWGRGYWGGYGGYGGWGGYRGYGGWRGYGPGYSTGYAEPMILRPDPAIIETRE